jgi:hypothetical protein
MKSLTLFATLLGAVAASALPEPEADHSKDPLVMLAERGDSGCYPL